MAIVQYPKWKYHVEFEEKIVNSADEEKALGPAWVDSPVDCGKPESAPSADIIKPKAKAKK